MPWGIALSGGGLLGAAHLGVWRALEQWGLEPGYWSGTSAGGLVAAAWASGVSWVSVERFGQAVAMHPRRYFTIPWRRILASLTGRREPPFNGLLEPEPFLADFLALIPAQTLDEVPGPLALTAVDIAQLQAVGFVNRAVAAPPRWRIEPERSLKIALRATIATPAAFLPLAVGPHLYIDGGAADTLPIDWAAALGADRVLAIDVTPARSLSPNRIGLASLIGRTEHFMTANLSYLREPPGLPLLVLRIPTEHIGAIEFSAYDQLVALGYQAMHDHQETVERFLLSTP
ncbi:MAG: patatin-like phospholipase family protein [Firmicutes bacterium]|nr:patatin-like phospholipase family protein [Alicyclobacillaceae bacterium]MCL6497886.1 patatin-like phospholipase family protein [Bacillota bacterium]